jgi:hypothetical protein
MVTQREAYNEGFDNGYGIAVNNQTDLRKWGKQKFISECLETESDHFRQFSPFEFTAAEFNRSRNPDAMWEAYENGVHKGILKAILDLTPKRKPVAKKPKRHVCNFCGWARPTTRTDAHGELSCTKRRKSVYFDDSCDYFKDMKKV